MLNSFIDIDQLSESQLRKIIDKEHKELLLSKKNIGLLFEKYSTRTRISFQVAISQLGSNTIDLKLDELNISRDETFEDTFRAMNCYLDGLVYRTTDHQRLLDASVFFKKPIINALSNKSHPCQIISDLFTLKEHFNNLNLNILWMGDFNNVCFSLIQAANLINELNLSVCVPEFLISKINLPINKNIKIISNLDNEDLSIFECVMTDVFISMNDENNLDKIELLNPYAVTSKLMKLTAPNSVFMHCLPARVGMEVEEEVFRGSKSIVWKQAYNRLIAQKNLLNLIYNNP